jgi:protein gp37
MGVMTAEIIGARPRQALMSFICNWCWIITEGIAEGVARELERDLGCKPETANSKIEWTHHTFNPCIGCQKVSPGCDPCYAETTADRRYHLVEWGPHGKRKRTSDATWRGPRKWAENANGHRQRVFCASWADVFDDKAPDGAREDLFDLIRDTPQLDWMLLTKRPENIAKMLPVPADWLAQCVAWRDL